MWPGNMLCAVRAMLWRRPAQRHVSTMLGQTVRGNGPWISSRLLPVVVAGSMARAFPPIRLSVSSKATALRPVASKAVLSVPPTDMATSQRHECTQLSSRSPEEFWKLQSHGRQHLRFWVGCETGSMV